MNGKEMKAHLATAGIQAQKVVYRRDQDVYIADFYVPELRTEIPSGQEWGEQMVAAFPTCVKIVEADELHAEWREGNPIIHASVTFTFHPIAGGRE